LPKVVEAWSLTSLCEKLIKIGEEMVSHGRYVRFQMAEVADGKCSPTFCRRSPGCGRRPRRQEGQREQMRRVTIGEVYLGETNAGAFGASLHINRQLRWSLAGGGRDSVVEAAQKPAPGVDAAKDLANAG
jgi:hypothetical protein